MPERGDSLPHRDFYRCQHPPGGTSTPAPVDLWHRSTTLAMLTHALLRHRTRHPPTPAGLITFDVNEFRRRCDALTFARLNGTAIVSQATQQQHALRGGERYVETVCTEPVVNTRPVAPLGAIPVIESPGRHNGCQQTHHATRQHPTRSAHSTTAASRPRPRSSPGYRCQSSTPSTLGQERRLRVDQCLFAVIMEPYLYGTFTREVGDLVKALGADSGISKSEVSRTCADLDTEVWEFRDRPLIEPPDRMAGSSSCCACAMGRRDQCPNSALIAPQTLATPDQLESSRF
jgi:Transposase, Mutator family